jgi:hypothetical protein
MHVSMPLLCSFDLDQCCLIVEISLIAFRKANCILSVKLLCYYAFLWLCLLESVCPSVEITLAHMSQKITEWDYETITTVCR